MNVQANLLHKRKNQEFCCQISVLKFTVSGGGGGEKKGAIKYCILEFSLNPAIILAIHLVILKEEG